MKEGGLFGTINNKNPNLALYLPSLYYISLTYGWSGINPPAGIRIKLLLN
jgi:hypothetical protein